MVYLRSQTLRALEGDALAVANLARYPDALSTYLLIGIHAARKSSRVGGAWRVWALGKAIDLPGLGKVRRDDLRAFVLSLGVNRRTWERWINEARAHDLVRDIQDKSGAWWVILPSPGRAALALGCENVGNRKVTIPAAALIGPGWKARVYTAWEHGKQISCEQIQKTANVPYSTQRYRRAQAGTKSTRNYSKSTMRRDSLEGVREYTKHKAPFVSGNGFIYWRVPDARWVEHAELAGKGRARKANKFIRNAKQLKALSYMRQGLTEDAQRGAWIRIFNLTEAQLQASERKIARHDRRIDELYQRDHEAKSGAVVWKHCPRGSK